MKKEIKIIADVVLLITWIIAFIFIKNDNIYIALLFILSLCFWFGSYIKEDKQ